MRRLAMCALTLALAIGAPVPALGDDHRPPPTRLRSAGVHQKGNLGTYCWTSGNTGVCADTVGYDWPRARRHPGDTRARIKIGRGFRPRNISLQGFWRVGDDHQPTGDGFKLDTRVTKRRIDGRLRYSIRWHVPDRHKDLHLVLGLDLFDESGERGDAYYTFHLEID